MAVLSDTGWGLHSHTLWCDTQTDFPYSLWDKRAIAEYCGHWCCCELFLKSGNLNLLVFENLFLDINQKFLIFGN